MDPKKRNSITEGLHVAIVRKEDQRTKELTKGFVRNILTRASSHPYGIKVRLETGEVGRVQEILD